MRNIFGWSLPPGCSSADVERAVNPDTIEGAFDAQAELTKEEQEAWQEEAVLSLVSKALEWAYQAGYKAKEHDIQEAAFYKERFKKEVTNGQTK